MTDTRPTTVIEALNAVMEDVRAVRKDSRNTHQNFNFRGIDSVMNAVGPALRAHGVVVVPEVKDFKTEVLTTSAGRGMSRMLITVTYRFYGPQGDHIDTTVLGESFDSGDKATPKAMSVAFRTALLQALCLPTDELDPDAQTYEHTGQHDPARVTRTSEPVEDDPWATNPSPSPEVEAALARQRDYPRSTPGPASRKQLGMIGALFSERGIEDHSQRLDLVNGWIDEEVSTAEQLTKSQASHVIDRLQKMPPLQPAGDYQD